MSESSDEERLQQDIEQLRGELGETVEALAHKADVPARAAEFKDDAIERGAELKGEAIERGGELKDQAVVAAERLGGTLRSNPRERWAAVAGVGLAMILLTVLVRRVQAR